MDSLTIREVLDSVSRGQIRIPAFQRGFVWEPDRVAYLMDSIYKGYPFGSLLFWRTKEKLRAERTLGPFELPEPKDDYPVDYVLDGQQRITSVFGVFQTALTPNPANGWLDIYFDLQAVAHAQETQFFALPRADADPTRYFPLKTLFETTAYRNATKDFDESTAGRLDEVQARFKEVRIPLQVFKTEDKAMVAIIFERINRQGVPLDTLQLLSAWTWSEEFQLQGQFEELSEQLAPFGFEDVGIDSNLILRCCSAILKSDASPAALMSLNGRTVRDRFDEVLNGVRGAVDYLRSNFNVHAFSNLPFPTVLVPLSVFFAASGNKESPITDKQRVTLDRWLWRSAFARRYSSGVLRNLKADIDEMTKLREGTASVLGDFPVQISPEFFLQNEFGMGNVNTKTFILLLASKGPLSFVSGTAVDLSAKLRACNRTEFHHLMPKAFLSGSQQLVPSMNALANFAFVSRADNRTLGGVAPSLYKAHMDGDVAAILDRALCPSSLFSDKYEAFAQERAKLLASHAKHLCG